MRIDWEGPIKFKGETYWVYLDYAMDWDTYGLSWERAPILEDIEVYRADGLRATELECDLFDKLGMGDLNELLELKEMC